jgi:hypothetical protein
MSLQKPSQVQANPTGSPFSKKYNGSKKLNSSTHARLSLGIKLALDYWKMFD